ncbi:hypothetical protein D9M69_385320 [compost metagenome]
MEDRPGGAIHRGLQVGILEDDIGALPAQLQLHALEVALGGLDDAPAGGGGAGEGDLAHVLVLGQALAGGVSVTRHHVDHAIGEAHFLHQFGDAQGGQRGDLRRLDHHRVAGGQGRAHLPTGEHQREVPRHDLADHADGLALHVIEETGFHRDHRAFDLVGHAAEVAEAGSGARHVQAAGVANRVAGVQGFQLGQLFEVFLDLVRQLQQQAPTLGARQCGPGRECPLGGGHRQVDVLGFGGSDMGNQRAVVRRQDFDGPALQGRYEAAVDEELVLHGKSSPGAAGEPRHLCVT